MNALAAPFLMCMPEMSALFAFSEFIGRWCPLYVQPNMRGVHCGIRASTRPHYFFFNNLLISSLSCVYAFLILPYMVIYAEKATRPLSMPLLVSALFVSQRLI